MTEEILKDFLDAAISSGADFVYPVSTEEDCVSKYPGVERTYVKIKGVKYTAVSYTHLDVYKRQINLKMILLKTLIATGPNHLQNCFAAFSLLGRFRHLILD